jgi:multidrug efflux pump
MLWGAFGVTLFGIFLTPVFYSVVRWVSDRGRPKPEPLPAKEGRSA